MSIKVQLKPEVEAGLQAQARARGISLEVYLEQVLQERSRTMMPPNVSAADKASAFEAWARSRPRTPPLPDEAVRRENLIRDA